MLQELQLNLSNLVQTKLKELPMLDWSKVKPATCRLCDQLIKESNGIIEEGEEDEFCITKPEFGLCVPCLCRCYNWCKKRMGVFTYCKPTDTEWAINTSWNS
jgi:hypothetical protein